MTRPARRLLVNVSVADIHREPAHESERVTQAVMGWRLVVIDSADGERWFKVRLPDGYEGWVRSWLVEAERAGWPGPRVAEVDAPLAWIRSAPEEDAEPVSDAVIGTILPARPAGRAGWLSVSLPDRREGFLARAELLRGGRAGTGARRPAMPGAILGTARRFMGVPYVWGGRSPRGLDCSGLIQMVLDLHGVSVPRDARDQRRALERQGTRLADPLRMPPASLAFFGPEPQRTTHVGFALGQGLLLHCQGRVRIQSLDPSNPLYHKDLAPLFQVGCLLPLSS